MAGEGYALAREELIRTLTAYSGITTADGASDYTSLIDNALIGKNDFLTGKSILIMSGVAKYETTGISAFNSTTGEITFATALSAQIVAGCSFRVLNTLPESVHITSGQILIMGYDYESGEWRKVRVTGSGEIAIAVTVADIVTAKISGEQIRLEGYDYESGEWRKVRVTGSGEIAIAVTVADIVTAKISGESVVVTSGLVVAKVSGESVVVTSGLVVAKISGESVVVTSGLVVAKVSGQSVVVTSGQVIGKISGETVIAKVSGETVSIETPTIVKTGPIRQLTDLSGGQVLHSGAIKSVLVKALAANSGMIAVGGSGDRPWYEAACSGQGLVLDGGEAVSLDVDNFDHVYVVAEVSGEQVSFVGVN